MKKILIPGLLLLILTFQSIGGLAQNKHSFEIKDGTFLYDGKPIQIHAGEIHYARVPQEYWRHRLKMIKAMGLNAVSVYVFWNYHNPSPGKWDFETGNHNLRKFIKTAREEGLFVLLRPGPYTCAEWEFGGYPWWLQKNKDLVIRTYNRPFLDSCKQYLSRLAEQVQDLQVTRGGPVVMVQVENEFGSYVEQRSDIPFEQHRQYCNAILQMVKEVGFDVPLYTADGTWAFKGGALPGVLPTGNGEQDVENLKKIVGKFNNGTGPYMIGEFYPGWLDHWGEPFARVPDKTVTDQLTKYLDNKISFSIYMVLGGTNFGFTAGANYSSKHDLEPDLTSYDYDAPISEAGWATTKYTAIRGLMQKYTNDPLPAVPASYPVIQINDIKLDHVSDVLDFKKKIKPVPDDHPLTFEELNQGTGYVLYSRKFNQAVSGKLQLKGLRDFAVIYVNGSKAGALNRFENKYEMDITIPLNGTLDILVENMGRINYGEQIPENTKGIIADMTINNMAIKGNWKMYKMPFDTQPEIAKYADKNVPGRPVLYSGTFNLKKPGDTFMDLGSWGKGIIFVNGHNLGRYWSIGPQQTLYLPGCWLEKGKNKIVVFEQLNDHVQTTISSLNHPILDSLSNSAK